MFKKGEHPDRRVSSAAVHRREEDHQEAPVLGETASLGRQYFRLPMEDGMTHKGTPFRRVFV